VVKAFKNISAKEQGNKRLLEISKNPKRGHSLAF
jgi:hypothetical protein